MKILIKLIIVFIHVLHVMSIENNSVSNHPNWPKTEEICGISYSDRIIGGKNSALGQYPWIAHLGIMRNLSGNFTLSYECAGALVHPKYVLTVGHCVVGYQNGDSLSTIKLGEHNLETAIDCENDKCADPPQILYPKSIIVPAEYDDNSLKHDIALIELNEEANITEWVAPICLPYERLIPMDLIGEIVEVAGWGYFDIDEPGSSPTLQTVKLPVVDKNICRQIKQLESYHFSKGQICVGGVVGKDSCSGDSGGPLQKVMTTKSNEPRYFLFGAVSVGVPSCGKFPVPAVYSNISYYMPWILENMVSN